MPKFRLLSPALVLLCATTLGAGLSACGPSSSERAQRSQPRIEVANSGLTFRRAPGPAAQVSPEGGLKIDDVELPLDEAKRAALRDYFAFLMIQGAQAGADKGTIAASPEAQAKREALLRQVPDLQPYADSFGSIRWSEQH